MLKAIVEMPMGTRYKYEVDKKVGKLFLYKPSNLTLDRPINCQVTSNYGYIVDTLADDGDPIDVFIAAVEPIPTLTLVTIEVVGMIKCVDEGKQDDKVLAYIKGDDFSRKQINMTEFVNETLWYLRTYKSGLEIGEVLGPEQAREEILKVTI